jgi:putative transposase
MFMCLSSLLLRLSQSLNHPAGVAGSAAKAGPRVCDVNPTRRVHELWQTDFTCFRVVGWGWYFLSTILDDYSRYIISWRLTTTMAARDITDTLKDALEATGLTEARVHHKPRLLSDNGPCYISKEPRE